MQAGFAMKGLLDSKNSQAFVSAAQASRTPPEARSRHFKRIWGPLTVEIVGRFDAPRCSGLGTRYVIRVKRPNDTTGWLVSQRYSSFEIVRQAMASRFPDLPLLPPKSEFRRRFSRRFREQRQHALEEFLRQAVMADAFADTPALRNFLSGDHLSDSELVCSAQLLPREVQPTVKTCSSSSLMEAKTGQSISFVSTAAPSSLCSRHSLASISESDEGVNNVFGDKHFRKRDKGRRCSSVNVQPNWVQIELDYMGIRDWDTD